MQKDRRQLSREEGEGQGVGIWRFSPAAATWLGVYKDSLFANRKLRVATLCQSPAQVGRACDEPRRQSLLSLALLQFEDWCCRWRRLLLRLTGGQDGSQGWESLKATQSQATDPFWDKRFPLKLKKDFSSLSSEAGTNLPPVCPRRDKG